MKIIDDLKVDEFGKRFGPDGGLFSLVVERPMDDLHPVRITGDSGEAIHFDSISLKELSSTFREMADWLEDAQQRIDISGDEVKTATA
jgi:hypothetical protein